MPINKVSTIVWGNRFLTMLGKDIIVAYLLTDKLDLVRVIQWLDMELIGVSYLLLAMRYSEESVKVRKRPKELSSKFNSLCLKSTMSVFRTCSLLIQILSLRVVLRLEKPQVVQFMLKSSVSIL